MTGASGSPYGVRLVEVLLRAGRTVHLTISPAAVEVFEREIGRVLRLDERRVRPARLLGTSADGLDLRDFTTTTSGTSRPASPAGRSSRRAW